MKIALRLLREFWLPALLAVGWTAYNVKNSGAVVDFKTLLNIFGPTFFLVSWATGQFFRIKKQAHVEQNLTSIEGRVESLVTKLEKHTQDFLGYTTGGGMDETPAQAAGIGTHGRGVLCETPSGEFDVLALAAPA